MQGAEGGGGGGAQSLYAVPYGRGAPFGPGPGSLLRRDSPISSPRDVLPALLWVPGYKYAKMEERYGDKHIATTCFPLGGDAEALHGDSLLQAQKDYGVQILHRLGGHVLPAMPSIPPDAAPFSHILAVPAPGAAWQERLIDVPGHPGTKRSMQVPSHLLPTCIYGESNSSIAQVCPKDGRLRVRLGPRGSCSNFTGEYAARIICWVLQGPPPVPWEEEPVAAHLCGIPSCVCPEHIAWLTRQQDAVCREWHKQHGKGHMWNRWM